MKPLAVAVIRAGLVPESTIAEMHRWKLPLHFITDEELEDLRKLQPLEEPLSIVSAIQDALDSEEQVRLQDTDLDLITIWINPANQVDGKLILIDPDLNTKATAKCTFCRLPTGEIAFPWQGEPLLDVLVNGSSYLQEAGPKKMVRHYFSDVREVFVGDTKAFVICSFSVEEGEHDA